LVLRFVRTTVTPGTRPPDGSVTCPETVAFVVCAQDGDVKAAEPANTNARTQTTKNNFMIPPLEPFTNLFAEMRRMFSANRKIIGSGYLKTGEKAGVKLLFWGPGILLFCSKASGTFQG